MMTFKSSSESIAIPKKINSILKHRSTYGGHNSDDSDSEEDEKFRRKYINLKSGHGMLISANAFSAHLDLSKSMGNDKRYYDDLVMYNLSGKEKQNILRSSKYSRFVDVPPLDLDSIQMSNDFEYGFNPNRLSGSKAGYAIKSRPLSLYSPRPDRQKPSLKLSNSDADEKYKSGALSDRPISHASNDIEENLERELASIRSQPCNLEFQGRKGKVNQKEFAEDLASSRRNRKIRRQLSFDSHPNQKWNKTLSLDSGLASGTTDIRIIRDKQSESEAKSQSQTLLDIDERDCFALNGLKKLSFSAEYIFDNDLTPVSTPDDDVDAESMLPNVESKEDVKIVPKFVDEKLPVDEILVHTNTNSYNVNNKQSEKHKKRSNIPHILSHFRLPNKKLMKLIKKKPSEGRNSPMKVPRENNPVILIEARTIDSEDDATESQIVASLGQDNKSFNESVNTFEKTTNKDDDMKNSISPQRKEQSESTHSLQKVDEDKESLEFQSPFSEHRRSKSTCSFTANKDRIRSEQNNHDNRRMSDTAIPFPEKQYPISHSPSKRFIRKLFSPVVCGLPSPDKQRFINGSLISLRSYDSGSIISECDDTYPHLFDFGSHELMEEMTLIDKELLVRIPWHELSILGWMSPDKNMIAANIMKMVEFFNRVVMLVTTSILAEENVYRRAKVVQKAIKLALKFRYQKNYNSLKAVLTGLQCTPVFRLKLTWKQVPSRYRRVFRDLSELMSEENNFYNYRIDLLESMENPPCIPFLGNFLTSVAHVHAFVATNLKCKQNTKKHSTEEQEEEEADSENDSCMTSPLPLLSPQDGSSEDLSSSCKGDENIENQVDPCMRSSTSKIHSAKHMRTDSDDSGVMLNANRLSRTSDDLEPSPRDATSSPDEPPSHNNTFNTRNEPSDNRFLKKHFSDSDSTTTTNAMESSNDKSEHLNRFMTTQNRHRRSVSEILISPSRHGRSVSVNDFGFRHAIDIASVINSRPVAREDNDDFYRCELQFWKYQIAAVQYRIIPKSYIRRYLMNSPYNTEEENYKLSLEREPPSK